MIKLEEIRLDGGTQCRVKLNQHQICDYRDRMKEGAQFPLLETVFDGAFHWLTDGFHRYHAMKLLGVTETEVRWKAGTQQDAVLEALKANSTHGLTLTNADKHNKIKMALSIPGYDQKSNYEIAKICGLSHTFVGAVRSPAVKAQQAQNKMASILKTAQQLMNKLTFWEPSADEAAAADREASLADAEAMQAILAADDKLAEAYAEIQRLNRTVSQQNARIKDLTINLNEAIKQAKYANSIAEKMGCNL